jgi:CRISPR-associated protein Csm3
MKLEKILEFNGSLELLSGLHIGAGDSEMHIGGTDSPVIKNPHNNLPYIPGSSIKGKMRSLLEWNLGLVEFSGGKPFGHKNLKSVDSESKKSQALILLRMFGISGGDKVDDAIANDLGIGLTRLVVRDCNLNSEWVDDKNRRNLFYTETKFENSINRIAGTADNPRNFERVPAGAMFDFAIGVKVLDRDNENQLVDMLFAGLKLIELDALGGSGSRGYGRVKFHLNNEDLQNKLNKIDPFTQAA